MSFPITDPPRSEPKDNTRLCKTLAELKAALMETSDETLLKERFLFQKNGETVISFPLIGLIQTVILNHSIHHRGQLSVYLRLLNIPVPAMYGTSADESMFDRG